MELNGKKRQRQKQESFLFVLMGLILLGLLVSGYFLFVEKVLPGISSGTTPSSQPLVSSSQGDSKGRAQENQASSEGETFFPGESQEITLYFASKGKDSLYKEIKKIPAEKMILNLAGIIVKNLIRGPAIVSEARALIPQGTQLRSLFYHQGTFFVDFSQEFVENHPGGASEEVLTVFSIVNTLTELDRKAKVRFLVNGHEVESIKGHVSLKQVFSRNDGLLASTR